MPKKADFETRTLMVLQEEAGRMSRSAERVRLVVQALALRRGVQKLPTGDDELFE